MNYRLAAALRRLLLALESAGIVDFHPNDGLLGQFKFEHFSDGEDITSPWVLYDGSNFHSVFRIFIAVVNAWSANVLRDRWRLDCFR